ncbi:phenoloxidase-activating factor 3-like isoform X2 [Photinus pyralis]|uniref:CLIP domain-containing serine protease n=1 Tax=Photinus pyralis TaxID=7054 RepID=A0A1Y1L1S6_PHOPY|nr:phenoloxidase-activating factor 3-like isoform X2 [Photinus pyralis]
MTNLNFIRVVLLVSVSSAVSAAHVAINCIPLVKCPQLLHLVQTDRDSTETIKILRSSHCGYNGREPKVWCIQVYPACKTPNGKSGRCMDASKCEVLQDLIASEDDLSNVVKYMKNAKCKAASFDSGSEPVCCPPDSDIRINEKPKVLPDPEREECGHQLNSKVIGGKSTDLDEFPWAALIQYQWKSVYSTNCGGTLISRRYVVTAAHCVDRAAIRTVGNIANVILGEYDTRNETDCVHFHGRQWCADPRLVVPVQEIIIHPHWNQKPPATVDGDIALVRLAYDVRFTDYIQPICLPAASTLFQDGTQLFVTGWGQTETDDASFVKLKTLLPVANKAECVRKYKQDKRLSVGDGMICVGGEAGRDSCSGDSGGPLMYPSIKLGVPTWYLTGVVSFGPNQPCGIKGYPGLYTHVSKYVEWIQETVQT